MTKPKGSIAANLRHFREQRKLTQPELARRVGVHAVTLARWEGGQRKPSAEHLSQISKALKVSMSALVGRANPQTEAAIEAYRKSPYWALRAGKKTEPNDRELDFVRYAIESFWVEGSPSPEALDAIVNLVRTSPELLFE